MERNTPRSSGTRTFKRPAFAGKSSTPARGGYADRRRPSVRPSSGGGGRFSRGGGRGGGGHSKHINPSLFVSKAVITEEVVHFVPDHNFTDFLIDESLKANILKKGYTTPTPIQDKAIPHILKGMDLVGIANTGTGKTAAFLIPLINKVITQPNENILVVVPTRELAIQIEEELKGFLDKMKIYSVVCVGGAPIGPQIRALRYRNEFVIGTPGRLKDLMEKKVLELKHFKTIVLDEADRMLDMGFVNDMRFMMKEMPKNRHTLFFSATTSPEVNGLIKEFLNEPVMISVKTQDTSKNVDQDVVRVARGENKLDVLHSMLIQPDFGKVLIFGRTKHGVEKLTTVLRDRGFKAESIHGDKNQSARQRSLKNFKEDRAQILVATDVAARGLDISGVSHVINFDLPATYEDYVHRIGRTGRAGRKGKALTFLD